MGFEDEYSGRQKKKDPLKPYYPLLGLLLGLAFAAIAYAVAPPVHQFIYDSGFIKTFPEPKMDTGVLKDKYPTFAVAGVIFVALVLIATVIFALFAPKPQKQVTENELKDEKRAHEREVAARKRRQARIRQQAAREREEQRKKQSK